jgi:ribosome-binding protein aMBF1 (putative translation factor)
MERLSGMDRRKLSREHIIAGENLAKLKLPEKKQSHPDLVENYDWQMRMARRRRKMTPSQLANLSGVQETLINELEKGIIPGDLNFLQHIKKIQNNLGIQLLKDEASLVDMGDSGKRKEHEKIILEEVRKKILLNKSPEEKIKINQIDDIDKIEETISQEKKEKLKKFVAGDLKISTRDNLKELKLSDLIEMKRQRDLRQKEILKKKQIEDMFGEEIEFSDLKESSETYEEFEEF